MVKYLTPSALMNCLKGEADIESDYEGDSQGANEEKEAPILIVGSFSAYAFLFHPFFASGGMT